MPLAWGGANRLARPRVGPLLGQGWPEGARCEPAPGKSIIRSRGLYTEFHPDGQLRHGGFYRQGRLVGPAISLEHGPRWWAQAVTGGSLPGVEPTTVTDEDGNEVEAMEFVV